MKTIEFKQEGKNAKHANDHYQGQDRSANNTGRSRRRFTGRKLILRLKFPNNSEKLPGHFNQARVLYQKYKLHSL